MFQEKDTTPIPFPENADVGIIIAGLAFCEFAVRNSRVNFLRHLPYHNLKIRIFKKTRDAADWIEEPKLAPPTPGKGILIRPENSVKRERIQAYGEESLNELVNLNVDKLHNGKVKLKASLPSSLNPSILTIRDCVFYTAGKSEKHAFHIKKKGDTTTILTKTGHTLGGKIRYNLPTGKTVIAVEGGDSRELIKTQPDGSELIYNIVISNHCGDENSTDEPEHDLCENLMGNDTDFRFYYDLLQDDDKKTKFTLEKKAVTPYAKKPVTADVAACNVVSIEPHGSIPPGDPMEP